MGKLRSSDLAVATAVSIVAWLMARTALRVEVGASVVAVSIAFVLALAARSRAGDARSEVELPLHEYFLALLVVRSVEAESFADRRASMLAVSSVIGVAIGAAIASRKRTSSGFVLFAVLAAGFSWVVGASGVVFAALWLIALTRLVAVVLSRAAAARLGTLAIVLALGSAVWAMRGATIGPLALLVGCAGAAGGLKHEEHSRTLIVDGVTFAALSVAMVLVRVWERSTLLFL